MRGAVERDVAAYLADGVGSDLPSLWRKKHCYRSLSTSHSPPPSQNDTGQVWYIFNEEKSEFLHRVTKKSSTFAPAKE